VGKKINLPLFDKDDDAPKSEPRPSLDAARKRLGGRIGTDGPALPGVEPGRVVTFASKTGAHGTAVVLVASAFEVHVLQGTRLRRLKPDAIGEHSGEVPGDLIQVASDARVFGSLSEGQDIRYADETGHFTRGKLIEKCRYGGLVARTDGVIVAVGFRKLWPAANGSEAS
jgi:hypothetical protein